MTTSRLGRARRTALATFVLVLAALAAPAASAASAAPSPGSGSGLVLVRTDPLGPRLRELTFRTTTVDGDVPVRVLLPSGFDPSGATRYPVLYLLHGGGGGARDWTVQGDAEAITAGAPLIVVMPDVTGYGNYVDWYNGGSGGKPMWETYVIHQLVPWVDANLPTRGDRAGRAIAGLSMGGGGATGLAARHPDLFTAAAAFSGAVDTNTVPVQVLAQTSGIDHGELPFAVFGDRLTQEVRWRGHNPWDLAANLRGLFLQLDTGNGSPGGPGGDTGDPVELAVHQMMENLHLRLTALDIPHLWNDYGAGGHAWFYWQRDLRELLPRLLDRFAHPVAAPTSFGFTFIEPEVHVWGWDVAVRRPAVEFAAIEGADRGGFTLRGTGAADVATAPYYRPGAPLSVEVTDAAGTRTLATAADASGRLHLSLSLGPGNPVQANTLEATAFALTQPGAAWPVRTATASVVEAPAPAAAPTGAAPSTVDAAAGGHPVLPVTGGASPVALAAALLLLALVARRLSARPG